MYSLWLAIQNAAIRYWKKVVAVDEMEPTLAADNVPYTTLG